MKVLARLLQGTYDFRVWKARRRLARVLQARPVVLSVEVTGLGPSAQLVEICLADAWTDHVLFRTRVDPTVPIRPQAQRQHGITEASLAGMPRYGQIAKAVAEAMAGRDILGYDVTADLRVLRQTCQAAGVEVPRWGRVISLMDTWAKVHGPRVGLGEAYSMVADEASETVLIGGIAKCHAMVRVARALAQPGATLGCSDGAQSFQMGA